jgi:hypothetical protein
MSELKLGGWVCLDDSQDVMGIGDTRDDAMKDAFSVIRDNISQYLHEGGIDISLSYFQGTAALIETVNAIGSDRVKLKIVRFDGEDIAALADENIPKRHCPETRDMFADAS